MCSPIVCQSENMTRVNFWNGNKSNARQLFESELLQAVLSATDTQYGPSALDIDNSDYASAEDEGNVFETGSDILVTVAGNLKFKNKAKIVSSQPLTKGLLGYRLLLVKNESLSIFKQVNSAAELQSLAIGIPETWADAELFRENQYKVVEKGSYEDLFQLLKKSEFDYTALGANEIEEEFTKHIKASDGICIEPSLMLYYPFPLVFYINPEKFQLAERVEAGLAQIMANGIYDQLFEKYYGGIVTRLNLQDRTIIRLNNSILPENMQNFRSTLLD